VVGQRYAGLPDIDLEVVVEADAAFWLAPVGVLKPSQEQAGEDLPRRKGGNAYD
jgi:hypothetical protein